MSHKKDNNKAKAKTSSEKTKANAGITPSHTNKPAQARNKPQIFNLQNAEIISDEEFEYIDDGDLEFAQKNKARQNIKSANFEKDQDGFIISNNFGSSDKDVNKAEQISDKIDSVKTPYSFFLDKAFILNTWYYIFWHNKPFY